MRRFRELGILAFLIVIVAGTSAVARHFLLPANLRNILLDIPLLIVVAMGMTMVIISRNIDLSVGSMLGLSGMVVGLIFKARPDFPLPLAMLTGVTVGLLLGAVNGALVAGLRVPAIIATLATFSIYRGLVFLISGGKQIDPNDIPPSLIRLSQTSPFGLPWLVLFAFAVALLAYLFLRYRRTGRAIYAVGSNPAAARLRGIAVNRITFLVFTVTGGLSGLAGVMYASRYGFINPAQTGAGFELSVIAATVIGGTDVFGGSGSVPGTVLGCLLLGVLGNALTVTGLSATWQLAVYGAIILVAVLTDSLLRRQQEKG
jgi:rhamnose transport system permease protein